MEVEFSGDAPEVVHCGLVGDGRSVHTRGGFGSCDEAVDGSEDRGVVVVHGMLEDGGVAGSHAAAGHAVADAEQPVEHVVGGGGHLRPVERRAHVVLEGPYDGEEENDDEGEHGEERGEEDQGLHGAGSVAAGMRFPRNGRERISPARCRWSAFTVFDIAHFSTKLLEQLIGSV